MSPKLIKQDSWKEKKSASRKRRRIRNNRKKEVERKALERKEALKEEALKRKEILEREALKRKEILESEEMRFLLEELVIKCGKTGFFSVEIKGIKEELIITEFSKELVKYIFSGKKYVFSKETLAGYRKVIGLDLIKSTDVAPDLVIC